MVRFFGYKDPYTGLDPKRQAQTEAEARRWGPFLRGMFEGDGCFLKKAYWVKKIPGKGKGPGPFGIFFLKIKLLGGVKNPWQQL